MHIHYPLLGALLTRLMPFILFVENAKAIVSNISKQRHLLITGSLKQH